MLKVVKLIQTCYACPSQWEGTLDDGRMIYIRFRWGNLTISVSPTPTTDVYDAVGGEVIYSKRTSDGLDGVMDYEEFKSLTKGLLNLPAQCEGGGSWD